MAENRRRWDKLAKLFNPEGSNEKYAKYIELFDEVQWGVEQVLRKKSYNINSLMRSEIRNRMRRILEKETSLS